jgi:hypothetical protein
MHPIEAIIGQAIGMGVGKLSIITFHPPLRRIRTTNYSTLLRILLNSRTWLLPILQI